MDCESACTGQASSFHSPLPDMITLQRPDPAALSDQALRDEPQPPGGRGSARLLVGVGPTPFAESLIRWARRAAGRHNCPWLAVWVERSTPLTVTEQDLLAHSLALARKLGAEVVHTTGDDVAEALLAVARERKVSQLVVGKSERPAYGRRSVADRIIAGSGDIDVCLVRPVTGRFPAPREAAVVHGSAKRQLGEYGIVCALVLVLGLVCWQFEPVAGYRVPALVYLFAILLAAFRFGRGPVLAMAGLSAVTWNYLFIPPRFTFHVRSPEDIIQLGLFFAVALCMGQLTTRLRTRERSERRRQTETDALLRVTHSAALIPEVGKGLAEALLIINAVIEADTTLIVRAPDHSLADAPHPASTWQPPAGESAAAAWAFANRQAAGRFTDTLPAAEATWFPLQTATSVMGVLGVRLLDPGRPLDFQRRQLLEALALQLALVLEKDHFIHAANQAELMERSEHLRRSLLDSFSHEFKTPLAIIQVALEAMRADHADPYLTEIDTAAKRLQRLVDGLLQMARLESKVVEPQLEWCDVADLVQGAIAAAGDSLDRHPLEIRGEPSPPLVKTDPSLLTQALANLLHNAGIYSPESAPIEIATRCVGGDLVITVRDHGPGVPAGEETRIFRKFHRISGTPVGGTGLGLSIVDGFVRALGGEVACRNHPAGGAVFEIRLRPDFLSQPEGDACPPLLEPQPDLP